MRTLTRTPSAEPASAADATAARRGRPGPAAARIVVAALVTSLAATAVVAESGRGHSPVARLSAASAAPRSGRSGPQTRQAPAAYSSAAVLTSVLSARLAPPKPTTITARGSVTCLSGRAVEGVWLVGLNGGSGWAAWRASAAAPQFATFSRSIPAGRWSVHVGCGGSPLTWKAALYSGWVSGTPHSFTCDDIPGLGPFGECSA